MGHPHPSPTTTPFSPRNPRRSQRALRHNQPLLLQPLANQPVDLVWLLRQRPVRGRDLAAGQVGDQRVHALGHLWLEDRVVGCLDEQDGLVDGFLG